MIRFEDVTLSPNGGPPALNALSFEVERAAFVWLYGPMGSGKTAALRLMHRAERPSAGQVFLADRDINTLKRRSLPVLRRTVAWIDARPQLIEDRSVSENVELPLLFAGEHPEVAARKARAALMDVGIAHKSRELASELSPSGRHLCAIARAMVTGPAVVLADEPTAGLDPELTGETVRLMRQAHIRGCTVIWATSNPALLENTPHRILRLARGQVVEDTPARHAGAAATA